MSDPLKNDAQPLTPLKLEVCGRTDVGLRRPQNEDSIVLAPELGLYAVADGMGGHAAGEVASRTAVDTIREFLTLATRDNDFTWPFGFDEHLTRLENLVQSGALLANHKICTFAQDNPDYLGMGTTLAVLFTQAGEIVIAHVGDSRVYRWRDGELQLLTVDHSWVNEQLQRHIITEEEAKHHRWRNVITRALGNRFDIAIDMQTVDQQAGDIYLLCSDGLTSMVEDEAIAAIMGESDGNLDKTCQALIAAANEAGGHDNISIILARVSAENPAA